METVYDFLRKCRLYYIATVENDQPRVRPFGSIDLFENKLYIQTGNFKNVAKQLIANPKVEICAFDGNSSWIRISGIAVEDSRMEVKLHMLESNPHIPRVFDRTQLFYIKDISATFYSTKEKPRVVKF